MNDAILEPEEHVLSTLERDGKRRWLKPKLSCGALHQRRQWMAWVLIVIFTVIPFIKIAGKPLILLNIPDRQFTILGFTFLPTDTLLLAIFMVGLLLTVFLFTALFGRVWCGWACPQTVYMEYVFRPIERFFDGTIGRGGKAKKATTLRTVLKYVVYFIICVYLANTFLAYFVGVDTLFQWVRQSPLEHPVPFIVMAVVTVGMMFDFCYFREQMCLITCPYGRFQSVLLDQNSLIVAYHENRGEPRGKPSKKKKALDEANASLPVVGDCVDCGKCVTTCPTGIDIRDGLQMECINCTQCIDACNDVMEKLGREPGLIRYSSQARDQGARAGLLRPRTLIYPVLLLGIFTAFVTVFLGKDSFESYILREPGAPYTRTDDGGVRNSLVLKLTSRSDKVTSYTVTALEPEGTELDVIEDAMTLKPGEMKSFHMSVVVPRSAISGSKGTLVIEIANDLGDTHRMSYQVRGPL